MKGNYLIAAGLALVGVAVYYFLKNRKTETPSLPQKENERHHLTNAFSRAKELAVGQ